MTHPRATLGDDSEFDGFLQATVREESHGMSVSVLSLLARGGIDPWKEAAALDRLAAPAAAARLLAILAVSPDGAGKPEAQQLAMRLVGLLPRAQSHNRRLPRSVAVPAEPGATKQGPVSAVTTMIVLLLLLVAWWLGGPAATRPALAPSPASSTRSPGVGHNLLQEPPDTPR